MKTINFKAQMNKLAATGLSGLALVLGVNLAQAQVNNPQYSQYNLTPLLTNPALSSMKADAAALFGYRSQSIGGAVGVQTPTLQLMYPFISRDKAKDSLHFGTLSALALQDRAGTNGMVATTGGAIGYSHNLPIGNQMFVNLGAQLGVFNRRIDDSKVRTGSQWDNVNGGYNGGIGNGETFNNASVTYVPVNLGFGFFGLDDNGDNKFYATIGASNANRPKISFITDNAYRVPILFNVVGGVRVVNTDQFVVEPSVRALYVNSEDYQANLGSFFRFKTHGGNKFAGEGTIGLGAWYSLNNAAVLALQVVQPGFTVGIAYDYITSGLADQNSKARAFEFVVGLRQFRGKKRRPKAPEEPIQTAPPVAKKPEPKPEPAPAPVVTPPAQPQPQPTAPAKGEGEEEEGDDAAGGGRNRKPVKLSQADLRIIRATDPDFEFNSIEPSAAEKAKMDKVIKVMKANPNLRVRVEGHTCNLGEPGVNQRVSELRAQAAKDYMIAGGIAEDRLVPVGLADTKPKASNATRQGRSLNRRVEFEPILK